MFNEDKVKELFKEIFDAMYRSPTNEYEQMSVMMYIACGIAQDYGISLDEMKIAFGEMWDVMKEASQQSPGDKKKSPHLRIVK